MDGNCSGVENCRDSLVDMRFQGVAFVISDAAS